ncbi:MAG: YfcE family phosphodiesterase [bacterium]|nr:YfcE family phosphodiesterase [bacterium]
MKLVALSDIHSNSIALEACINDIKKEQVDGIVFLGDYVSDCPHPNDTLRMLREISKQYKTYFIRGNREEYFVDYREQKCDDWGYTSYKGSLLYTYEHLNDETLNWFESLPYTMVLEIEGAKPITLAHGSPFNTRELLDEDRENTKLCLKKMPTQYIISGHTHRQCVYRYGHKTLFNPGSVGVAIGAPKQAHYMVLEWKDNDWIAERRSVAYDFDRLKEVFYGSHLMEKGKVWPLAILKSIETGINYGPLCAKRAYDLAIEHGEEVHDRIVPEKYWEIAAKEYQVL